MQTNYFSIPAQALPTCWEALRYRWSTIIHSSLGISRGLSAWVAASLVSSGISVWERGGKKRSSPTSCSALQIASQGLHLTINTCYRTVQLHSLVFIQDRSNSHNCIKSAGRKNKLLSNMLHVHSALWKLMPHICTPLHLVWGKPKAPEKKIYV